MKIVRVTSYPVSIPLDPDLAIISSREARRASHYVIIVVEADNGTTGFGEATVAPGWSGEFQSSALAAINDILAPMLSNRDPLQVSLLSEEMDRALIGNPFAKAGVEIALLDLAGKSLKVPIHVLLGGARRELTIPLRFSVGAFQPSKAVAVAEKAVQIGLRAVKVKVGTDVGRDLERVQAIRQSFGEQFPIGVDANGGWSENEVAIALPHLERLGVNVIEQPLRRGDFRGCARIRKRTHIPIMLDESVFTPEDALEAVRNDACDLISIYPGKNGGICRSMEIAHIASAAGIECTIGSNLEFEICSAAMLHLAAAVPNLSSTVHHDIIGPIYHTRHIGPELQFAEGCAHVPTGPGLGIIIETSLMPAER